MGRDVEESVQETIVVIGLVRTFSLSVGRVVASSTRDELLYLRGSNLILKGVVGTFKRSGHLGGLFWRGERAEWDVRVDWSGHLLFLTRLAWLAALGF